MKVIGWNIRWGGGARCGQISETLVNLDADVIVLSEYQPGTSAPLIASLGDAGWTHQVLSTPPHRYGGAAVLSKTPVSSQPLPPSMLGFEHRYLSVAVPEHHVELRAVYAPLQKDPYAAFWSAMLADLKSAADQAVLVIGDLNAGASGIDSPSPDFLCSDFFIQLPVCGYSDLWRAANREGAREYSWLGTVNPYRLDHAFGTARVADRLISCHYLHDVREAGLSDHSLLSVELA